MAGALPYLYESNLRRFCEKFDAYIKNGHLTVRLWKDGDNTYHLKGVWVDNQYILLTGNNLNPRAWRFRCGKWIINPRSKTRTSATSGKRIVAHPPTYQSIARLF